MESTKAEAATAPTSSSSSWVEDTEKMLANEAAASEWRKRSIYLVPARMKNLNGAAYKPQTVSLGPFHHGDPDLLPMEEHKRRALRHVLRRAGKPLAALVAAVEAVAEQLVGAYGAWLDGKWRTGDRFLGVMIMDGCFLLEVMRRAGAGGETHVVDGGDDDDDEDIRADPVFSRHLAPYVQRDMLLLENQLPLLVLDRIAAVESGKPPDENLINRMVLKFLGMTDIDHNLHPAAAIGRGLHPLDIYRKSLLAHPQRVETTRQLHHQPARSSCLRRGTKPKWPVDTRSARKLHEAGIRFRCSGRAGRPQDIRFYKGTLTMPQVVVDDATESRYLNLMAFEALHAGGVGDDVTAYVLFMRSIVSSADDVHLLRSKGIVRNDWVDGDEAVVRLFNDMTKDVVCDEATALCSVHGEVEDYCRNNARVFLHKSWFYLRRTYFRNPWTFLSLAAGIFVMVTDVIQTVYAVLSYEVLGKKEHRK